MLTKQVQQCFDKVILKRSDKDASVREAGYKSLSYQNKNQGNCFLSRV